MDKPILDPDFKLKKYVDLLNLHFPSYNCCVAWVDGYLGELGCTSDEAIPEGKRLYMEEMISPIRENQDDAIDAFIDETKKYLRNNLKDNNPKTKKLFWRVRPEVIFDIDFDSLKTRYKCYSRLAIYNG